MALVQDNKTKLFLTSQSGTWGSKQEAIRLRHRFPVEQAVRYAQILREKGYDVTAVLDTGGSCEQTLATVAVNETIDYRGQHGEPIEWRIDVQKVQAGYMHRWVDSDTRQQFQIIAATPQLVFERLRDVQDIFSERHISELHRVMPAQPVEQQAPPAQAQSIPGLRAGDAARYNGEQPTYRSYYNPNGATAEAVPASETYAAWERTASCADVKKRAAVDAGFASWYNAAAAPATNKQ
jgi:hypothetical protein